MMETHPVEVDKVMTLTSQMAYGLERSTSIEFAMGTLVPAGAHLTQALHDSYADANASS